MKIQQETLLFNIVVYAAGRKGFHKKLGESNKICGDSAYCLTALFNIFSTACSKRAGIKTSGFSVPSPKILSEFDHSFWRSGGRLQRYM